MNFGEIAAGDAESLVAIRIEAMRESLERIGRFDATRARERFLSAFDPARTRSIEVGGERAGFYALRPDAERLVLDHLYIRPSHQGRGLGARVLEHVFTIADSAGVPVRVGALRDSDSNRFYARHGFALVERAEFDNYYAREPQERAAPGAAWMPIAACEWGVRAHPAGRSNARITQYHAGTNIEGYDDKASWCSSFVNWSLAQAGFAGTGSALARSWLDWGRALDAPVRGCVAVLSREDPAGWKGHVAFLVRADGDEVRLLGGNQLGEVREHGYAAATVLGWRWPESVSISS